MILDAPPGCACPFVATVMDADKVILVTEPTPFGLSDLKHTVQVLRTLNKDFSVVVNRSDMGDDALRNYLEDENIELLGEIPYSEKIASIYSHGKLVVDEEPTLCPIFENLLSCIL